MVHPTGYMRKEGVVAAQNRHLGRTYVSKLYPVPVSDAVTGGLSVAAVELVRQGSLVDTGVPDHVSGSLSVVGVVLYTPTEHLDDAVHGTLAVAGVVLRTPQVDTSMQPDNVQGTGVTVQDVSLRVAHVIPPVLGDAVTGSGIAGISVTLITN